MSRKLYLSIFLLIPLLLTGYALQAKEYPCVSKVGECLMDLNDNPTVIPAQKI